MADFSSIGYEEAMRRARECVPVLAGRAQECEDARILLPENEKLLHETGLFRFHQPRRFGGYWHLNLHSMPSNVYERLGLPARRAPDVALGDLDGRTCEPEFLDVVRRAFADRGYSVSVNDPYKGQDLIRAAGRPGENRHSLQIEFNRALYMDEKTREPNAGFAALQADIGLVLRKVAGFVRDRAALRS